MKLCPFQCQNILIMQHMELHCGFVVTFLSLFSFFPWKKKSWIKLRDNLKVLSSLYANWVTTNSCYLTHFMNNQKATEHVLCLFVSTLYKGCSEASVPCRSCLMNKGQYTLFFWKTVQIYAPSHLQGAYTKLEWQCTWNCTAKRTRKFANNVKFEGLLLRCK